MSSSIFSNYILENRLNKNNFLKSIDSLLDWDSLELLISHIHVRDFSHKGRKSYSRLSMLKAILIQQWYNLSDIELEDNLRDRLSFIQFCNLDLEGNVPDHSTICRFRHKLIKNKLHLKLFQEVNNQLLSNGISIKSGTAIDASLIHSHSHPNRKEYVEIEPTGDEDHTEEQKVTLEKYESKDPDARWIKKGKRSVYGYKANIAVDLKTGIIQKVITTSANIHDITSFPEILKDLSLEKGTPVLADKGYSSKKIRELIRSFGFKQGIMYKKYKNDILQKLKLRFNKQVSKYRYIVEQTFGCLHSHYDFGKTPYVGLEKTEYFLVMKSLAFNLKRSLRFYN